VATDLHPALPEPSVVLSGGIVQFNDFVESDPDVVRVIESADEPEAAAHALLRIGAQAVRIASTDLDTELVERRFGGMAQVFDTTVSRAVSGIAEATGQLLDEETGTLPKVIEGIKVDLEALLGDTFDADSKTSVIAKIERVLTEGAEQLAVKVRATFNLDQPDSPLARTKRELVEVVKDEIGVVVKEVRDIAVAVAGKAAAAEMVDKLTAKGGTFEELIAGGIDQIASIHGDVSERVGTTAGARGTKKGDHRITICQDDTCGLEARFVLEAKDRGLSMSKTMAELDAAMHNHDAVAAIAVFARADLAPVSLPFWYSGNRAILIFDKDRPDQRALHLAYEWARWIARRSVVPDGETAIDVAEVEAAITRVRQALAKHQAIKSCHSVIRKKADEAGLHVAGLVDEVDQAMRDLIEAMNPFPITT
jgi:hypothetical protein